MTAISREKKDAELTLAAGSKGFFFTVKVTTLLL